MAGVEIAQAYIALTTKMPGVAGDIKDQLGPAEAEAEKSGERTGRKWSDKIKVAMGIGAVAATGAAVAAFKGLYDIGEVFDEVTDTIRTGTGAQGEALDGLVDVAKKVGQQVPAEFEQIGSVVADLNTRLGLSGETLEKVASQYLEAGRLLGGDIDINSTTAAFNAFKISGDGVAAAMDTLFQVSQATGVGINELAAGAVRAAPALQNLGFTFEDSVALLGSLDKAGLNANAVLASFSKGMVTLAKDGEAPAKAFERVTKQIQKFVDKGKTAQALDLAGKVFGTRGAAQFVGALQSGVLSLDDLMAATGATGDTILGVGEETMDFAEKWQMTMNQAMVAIEPLASAVFTAIGDGLTAVMPYLTELGNWLQENPVVMQIAVVVLGALATAFVVLTVATWALNAALLANPITWIILAIVALIAAVVLLIANWDAVVQFLTEVWNNCMIWLKGALDAFLKWWNELWTAVWEWIVSVWNNIVSAVNMAFTMLYRVVKGIGDGIAKWWNDLWQGIFNFFDGIWKGIINAVVNVQNAFRSVFNAIAGIVRGAFEGVVSVVRGVINSIIDAVNGVIGGINAVAGAVGDAIGINIRVPSIPRLAQGGIVSASKGGTLAVIGEGGRDEAVVPLPPDWKQNGLGGGSGLTINGDVYTQDVDEFVRTIETEKRRAYARAGVFA